VWVEKVSVKIPGTCVTRRPLGAFERVGSFDILVGDSVIPLQLTIRQTVDYAGFVLLDSEGNVTTKFAPTQILKVNLPYINP